MLTANAKIGTAKGSKLVQNRDISAKRNIVLHGVRKGVNEGMTTSSVNRMARLEKMTELDPWDK